MPQNDPSSENPKAVSLSGWVNRPTLETFNRYVKWKQILLSAEMTKVKFSRKDLKKQKWGKRRKKRSKVLWPRIWTTANRTHSNACTHTGTRCGLQLWLTWSGSGTVSPFPSRKHTYWPAAVCYWARSDFSMREIKLANRMKGAYVQFACILAPT